ncbi:MAG: hypothetical protein R6U98_23205, partial [Pirellulaceae bacterium]
MKTGRCEDRKIIVRLQPSEVRFSKVASSFPRRGTDAVGHGSSRPVCMRDFIEVAEREGELKRITAEVDWNLELSHIETGIAVNDEVNYTASTGAIVVSAA